MSKSWVAALLCLALIPFSTADISQTDANTYDYIVVGSGPGGGPLASNLAKAGASVLLLEAGDDQGANIHEEVPGLYYLAWNDPLMRWDFFVKYSSNDTITQEYIHLTWKTVDGEFYVGTDPPAGAEMLGVYYPRAGTLGGCSTHNTMCATLPSNSDWDYIANLTSDDSWNSTNMRQYFERLENDHSVPVGTEGHGFDGYLDITVNTIESLQNQSSLQEGLKATLTQLGQDPNDMFEIVLADYNNDRPDFDYQIGMTGFPLHKDLQGRRVSARNPVVETLNVTSNLTLSLQSLVTKVLFDTNSTTPLAIGVEYLAGQSMYAADPRYNSSVEGQTLQAFARKEVILSGGAFNSPQILKLSGIGPAAELESFNISVLLDLPGVGANLQDNNELGVIGTFAEELSNIGPVCTSGAPGDPCLAAWENGTGPYAAGPGTNAFMYKSDASIERDLFMWMIPTAYRGYWPFDTVNVLPTDPASTMGINFVKMHSTGTAGTVLLASSNPREMPDINFRFFEGGDEGAADIQAMSDAVDFARAAFGLVESPLGPFAENFPCDADQDCDVKEVIKTQTWSHHATSTNAIGADGDPMAVLDSRFRVRGVNGLRVVDGSAFPKTPGGFPVLPTFMISEKASDVILEDTWF